MLSDWLHQLRSKFFNELLDLSFISFKLARAYGGAMVTRQSESLLPINDNTKYSQLALSVMLGLVILLFAPIHFYSLTTIMIGCGLTLFLVGDFLLVTRNYKRARFATYSAGCLIYSLSFWQQTNGITNEWLPILLCASGIVTFLLILPQVESRFLSTLVIGSLLLLLLWAVGQWWIQQHSLNAFCALLGSAALLLTSLLVAIRKEPSIFNSRCRICLLVYPLGQAMFVVAALI